MQIYERNGIIYLKDFHEDYEWVTNDYDSSDPFFILSNYTRECFKQDILPYIKSKQCYITPQLFSTIKYYKANPIYQNFTKIVQLPGITYKDHQVSALKYMSMYRKFGFFLGPGSGKTIIAIAFLLSANIKSAIIVTPQKVISQYKSELDKYIPGNNFIVTNYEQLHKYAPFAFEAVILDESHKVKNFSSNANEYCRMLASNSIYTYLFTGTPQDKSRHEILSQIAILDPRVMPVKTRTLFRYFNQDDYFKPSTEKRQFSRELTSIIETYTWGKPTEEVVQLTKENDYTIHCTKSTEYDILLKDRVLVKHFNGERYRCVADNKGVLKVKLRELCNGHIELVSHSNGTILDYIRTDKSDKLEELLSYHVNKGIIYYEFDNDLPIIEKELCKQSINYRIVNGHTNKKNSAKYIEEFKQGIVGILVMQSKSGNAGLDLTNVNDIIFYSLPESYITFTQCKARINRIGQTKECNYYYLICKDSIEEQMLVALRRKKNFSTRLFKIYN
jgi:SNF2 family DNA or RNA helicase